VSVWHEIGWGGREKKGEKKEEERKREREGGIFLKIEGSRIAFFLLPSTQWPR